MPSHHRPARVLPIRSAVIARRRRLPSSELSFSLSLSCCFSLAHHGSAPSRLSLTPPPCCRPFLAVIPLLHLAEAVLAADLPPSSQKPLPPYAFGEMVNCDLLMDLP